MVTQPFFKRFFRNLLVRDTESTPAREGVRERKREREADSQLSAELHGSQSHNPEIMI